jgi:uncharacterized protein
MIIHPIFSRIFPFAIYMGFFGIAGFMLLLQQEGFPLLQNWDPRWLYPTKILLVLLALLLLWRNYGELARPAAVKPADWLLGVAIGVLVFVVWINLDQGWATIGDPQGYNPTDPGTGSLNWNLIALRISGAALIVPVMEELFWRSFIMRWLKDADFAQVDPARVGFKPFFITAVLFASEHNLWLAGLLAGIAYNWLYMRSRNLWVPVLAHAVTNGLLGLWVVQTGKWQFW